MKRRKKKPKIKKNTTLLKTNRWAIIYYPKAKRDSPKTPVASHTANE